MIYCSHNLLPAQICMQIVLQINGVYLICFSKMSGNHASRSDLYRIFHPQSPTFPVRRPIPAKCPGTKAEVTNHSCFLSSYPFLLLCTQAKLTRSCRLHMPMNTLNNIQCFQHNHGLTHSFMCLCLHISVCFRFSKERARCTSPAPHTQVKETVVSGPDNPSLTQLSYFLWYCLFFIFFCQSHSLKMYKRTIKITTYYRQHIFQNILFLSALEMSSDEIYSDTTAIFECFSEYDELLQQFTGLQESVNVMAFWQSLTHTDKCPCLIQNISLLNQGSHSLR